MRKMRIFSIIVFILAAICISSPCFSASLGETIDKALELREAEKIEEAVAVLKEALQDESIAKDSFTKGYLETLIQCLQADELYYLAIVKSTSKSVRETKNAFLDIAEELKIGEISRKSKETIEEMKGKISKLL
ncbi:MAG: hypothetical protein JW869_06690, partial [Candidatus Omnitrophica bacterium]|nr:hypothetical protein [Candidatus Omnitrophota bacterium]